MSGELEGVRGYTVTVSLPLPKKMGDAERDAFLSALEILVFQEVENVLIGYGIDPANIARETAAPATPERPEEVAHHAQ